MSFLVAKGTKYNGAEFESYLPMPTSNIFGSKGKMFELCHFKVYLSANTYPNYFEQHIGIVFFSDTTPPTNANQSWYVDFFQANVKCNGVQGTCDLYSNANPRFEKYNEDIKTGVISFNYTNDNPSNISGFSPHDLLHFYQSDNVTFFVPDLGTYYAYDDSLNDSFWKRAQTLKPKLPFEFEISKEGGGDGEYDDNSSDTIGLPDLDYLNANSISNTKFFSCYKMTPHQLSVLSEHLWTDWRNITEAIGNSILKPLDFVISLNMLPVNVESTAKVIKMGWFTLNSVVQGGLINQQYVRVDCGSLTVTKKWGGAIDYQTDVSLFLPFIGEVTLNANEVMGATLTVIYTVDIMSGNCIASVQVVKDGLNAILYQYNGNVASNFSITSLDYSNVMAGALQLAVAVGTGAGGGAGAFASAVTSTSNLLSGAEVRRAGNLSATSGFMGIKKPYLILSRPIQSLPSDYNTFRGYVSNITLALSECSGFTKVAEIHLENIPATSAELDELDALLKAGVIF